MICDTVYFLFFLSHFNFVSVHPHYLFLSSLVHMLSCEVAALAVFYFFSSSFNILIPLLLLSLPPSSIAAMVELEHCGHSVLSGKKNERLDLDMNSALPQSKAKLFTQLGET